MRAVAAAVVVSASFTTGCLPSHLMTESRLEQGLVIILPGIDGPGLNTAGVTDGLEKGGVEMGVMTHAWGWPIPGIGMMLNQTDTIGARAAGQRVAQMVADYKREHPGKPAYIIGHSGGGAVAVFAAESMPAGQTVDGLVLLSASISAGYNLSRALGNCRSGILNYYSHNDGILPATEGISQTVDGVRGTSAGLSGFRRSSGRLYQMGWSGRMTRYGNGGSHMASCSSAFIAQFIAPWIASRDWPAQ